MRFNQSFPQSFPKQEAEEYEKKLKEVQEEQATYRKALELELKKLRTEVRAKIYKYHTVARFGRLIWR